MNNSYERTALYTEIVIRIIGIILIILAFIFFLIANYVIIDNLTSQTMRVEKVKCYDQFLNEIIGQQCSEIIKCGVLSKVFNKEYCYGGGQNEN